MGRGESPHATSQAILEVVDDLPREPNYARRANAEGGSEIAYSVTQSLILNFEMSLRHTKGLRDGQNLYHRHRRPVAKSLQ